MEQENRERMQQEEISTEEETGYTPRPLWQVIGAWAGLILFILVMVFFYINMVRGGI